MKYNVVMSDGEPYISEEKIVGSLNIEILDKKIIEDIKSGKLIILPEVLKDLKTGELKLKSFYLVPKKDDEL